MKFSRQVFSRRVRGLLTSAALCAVVALAGCDTDGLQYGKAMKSLSPEMVGQLEATRRFLLREPERSRRVLRLLCANYLAHAESREQPPRGVHVRMPVVGDVVVMHVAVHDLGAAVVVIGVLGRGRVQAAPGVAQAQHPEQYQHPGDQQLEYGRHAACQADPEHDDHGASRPQRDGVTDAPQDPHEGTVDEAALAADDGGHRDQVIGIGGVLDTEDEPQRGGRDDGIGHAAVSRTSAGLLQLQAIGAARVFV